MEVVKYCPFIKVLLWKENPFILQETVQLNGGKCPWYITVTYWVRKLISGFIAVMDEDQDGHPSFKENFTIEKKDLRITDKQHYVKLESIIGSNELILHDHLNMNKVSAR